MFSSLKNPVQKPALLMIGGEKDAPIRQHVYGLLAKKQPFYHAGFAFENTSSVYFCDLLHLNNDVTKSSLQRALSRPGVVVIFIADTLLELDKLHSDFIQVSPCKTPHEKLCILKNSGVVFTTEEQDMLRAGEKQNITGLNIQSDTTFEAFVATARAGELTPRIREQFIQTLQTPTDMLRDILNIVDEYAVPKQEVTECKMVPGA